MLRCLLLYAMLLLLIHHREYVVLLLLLLTKEVVGPRRRRKWPLQSIVIELVRWRNGRRLWMLLEVGSRRPERAIDLLVLLAHSCRWRHPLWTDVTKTVVKATQWCKVILCGDFVCCMLVTRL